MINPKNYYLDTNLMKDLPIEEKDRIHNYYRDMLSYYEESRHTTSGSFFNTLLKGGFIKDKESEERDEKIDLING